MDIETVISKYQGSLRAFLLARLRNPADVDDLLQDVFTKTFRHLHTLKADAKVKPWLFQIANNALMDHYRTQARDHNVNADDLWYNATEEETEHAFERCIEPFLSVLPTETSTLLRAIELDGVSQKDYAAQLGISYSTLKSRVQSARRQLRGLFDRCCDIAFAPDGSVIDFERKSNDCKHC